MELRADVTWEGRTADPTGTFTVGTNAVPTPRVNWMARTGEPGAKTSPGELLAASHATCYAMSLSGVLARAGHEPEELRVSAAVTFVPQDGGGVCVTRSALSVRACVPGLDTERFAELAREGEAGCPVSNALRGNVEITVEASLDP